MVSFVQVPKRRLRYTNRRAPSLKVVARFQWLIHACNGLGIHCLRGSLSAFRRTILAQRGRDDDTVQ